MFGLQSRAVLAGVARNWVCFDIKPTESWNASHKFFSSTFVIVTLSRHEVKGKVKEAVLHNSLSL